MLFSYGLLLNKKNYFYRELDCRDKGGVTRYKIQATSYKIRGAALYIGYGLQAAAYYPDGTCSLYLITCSS